MASIVKIKRSSVQGKRPTISDLQAGELALNTRDGKLFSSDGSVVFEVGANTTTLNVGTLTVGNTNAFTFPTTDGSSNQVLATDGSGSITFVDIDTIATSGVDRDGFTQPIHYTTTKIENGFDFGLVTDGDGIDDPFQLQEYIPIYEMNEPLGRFITVDMGSIVE